MRLLLTGIFLTAITLVVTSVGTQGTKSLFTSQAENTSNTFVSASAFPSVTPTPTPTPSQTVVINEINWAGNDVSPTDEWIELYNTTDHSIDLLNWTIENLGDTAHANYTIATSSAIPPNGYFLISAKNRTDSHIDVDPDIVLNSNLVSFINGGEILTLKDNTGTVVDIANKISGWFAGSNISPRTSMERKNPPGDGTLGSNWGTATTQLNMDLTATESGTPKGLNDL